MENLQEINKLIKFLSSQISDGFQHSLEIDGIKLTLSNKDGVITINIDSNKDNLEDNSENSLIKETINEFKEFIEELDDCLFLESIEEIEQYFDIKRFNDLLEQKEFTDKEETEVIKMIEASKIIIREHLQDKIEELVELYDKIAS